MNEKNVNFKELQVLCSRQDKGEQLKINTKNGIKKKIIEG